MVDHSEPAYAKRIQESITHNGLSSFLFLHGSLDKEPLLEKLKQAHVLAVPSSYEGFGIVYLEGMCFGLPSIGTTSGAAGEVIEHGRTGYLIPPDDRIPPAHPISRRRSWLLTRLSVNAASVISVNKRGKKPQRAFEVFYIQCKVNPRLRTKQVKTMDYSFPHYLLSKQTVDDRALNKDVLQALRLNLSQPPVTVIEVGAGIGTMLKRLIQWDVLCTGDYILVDEMAANIAYAREWIPQWATEAGLSVEARAEPAVLTRRDILIRLRMF
jgi:hypothetical protein